MLSIIALSIIAVGLNSVHFTSINNNFYQPLAELSLSYTVGPCRHSCTVWLPKQQRHSREVLSCIWAESWLPWCWGSPWALGTLLIPMGCSTSPQGPGRSATWNGPEGSMARERLDGANTLVRAGTSAWVGSAGGAGTTPTGSAAAQCLHPFPAMDTSWGKSCCFLVLCSAADFFFKKIPFAVKPLAFQSDCICSMKGSAW